MSIFNVLTLFGGLAMFLYGMRIMGDGLKEGSSGTLKRAMNSVTNSTVKAFLLGLVLTAIIQSSTATIVITSGLVGAGILTLHQSLGIIVGANVGTTVTGQIIRLIDVDASGTSWLQLFKPSTLAPIALIIGIILILGGGKIKNSKTVGAIAIGFGILFTGLLTMTGAVDTLSESGVFESLLTNIGGNPFIGYLTGAGVAFILQSSSATIGILQAFSQSGLLSFGGVYAVIVGIYLGDCLTTAIVCSIGAGTEAKRVGAVNIMFNLSETVLVLIVVNVLHATGLLDGIWNMTVRSGDIANTNTIFNLSCAIVLLPVVKQYEKLSQKIIKDKTSDNKYQEKLDALSEAFLDTPALALGSCYDILSTMLNLADTNIRKAWKLMESYDETVYEEIMTEEDNIDLLTDRLSRYLVELSPHLSQPGHVAILDEYYKVVAEMERLGDHAVNLANGAKRMAEQETRYSEAAMAELSVLESLTGRLLDNAKQAFLKFDVQTAYRIEPEQEVGKELIHTMRDHHLKRMVSRECDVVADAYFMNLLVDFDRIGALCSNIGMAVIIRANPYLADQSHEYVSALHSGDNENFNQEYEAVHKEYFALLKKKAV